MSEEERERDRRARLLAWYDEHKRALPWRATRDAYAVWVSEVMLQQTRVDTVVPYYQRFLERFPTVRALAEASEERVLTAWSGLGYYRRARLLHQGARAVLERHAGEVPSDPAALRALPGVGAYTAGAIASIAFGRAEPLVDGNVQRVLTRWDALEGDPKRAPLQAELWRRARSLAQGERPGDLNQALMELGATVCSPQSPRCLLCPVRASCEAYARGEPERFPTEMPRREPPFERWWAALVREAEGPRVWLSRSPGPRWKGLLVPPRWPRAEGEAAPTTLRASLGEGLEGVEALGPLTQQLTAATTEYEVLAARATPAWEPPKEGAWVHPSELEGHPVPRLTRLLLARLSAEKALPTTKARRERG